jgi:hypothetical protein
VSLNDALKSNDLAVVSLPSSDLVIGPTRRCHEVTSLRRELPIFAASREGNMRHTPAHLELNFVGNVPMRRHDLPPAHTARKAPLAPRKASDNLSPLQRLASA